MKLSLLALATAVGSACAYRLPGFDISGWQPKVDFAAARKDGARFVIIKATEGTTYKSPAFSDQWTGANKHDFVRGSYHFAQPSSSSGAAQAKFFVKNGGGWTADGRTLPGMLDLEKAPNKPKCFDLSTKQMESWIKDFSNTYHDLTKRYPMIYASPDWWKTCTGDSTAFNKQNPLVLARWGTTVGKVFGKWSHHTIWQYDATYKHGGNSNYFIGNEKQLRRFAKGASWPWLK